MQPKTSTEEPFVTFIIPTIGRETLSNSFKCLIDQTDPNWKAIVIFDGMSLTIESPDHRIKLITCEKLGDGHNGGGSVRNYGMQFVDTEWIAFLDDDDSISREYVSTLKKEITNYNDIDFILFRMEYWGHILPHINASNVSQGCCGISFAIRSKIFKGGHKFKNSSSEDFKFLCSSCEFGYKFMLSSHILYFARKYKDIENKALGTRLYIN